METAKCDAQWASGQNHTQEDRDRHFSSTPGSEIKKTPRSGLQSAVADAGSLFYLGSFHTKTYCLGTEYPLDSSHSL